MLLNQYWQLQQSITTYCQTNRYPLWRSNAHGFGEQYSYKQIAQWTLGFVAALEKFYSLELFVEYFSADWGDSARVFLSKGEVNAEQNRIIFTSLHARTNEPLPSYYKNTEIFKTTQIPKENSVAENSISIIPPKKSYWPIRLGGILVALLGLYIAFVIAQGETFAGPAIIFSIVLIVWGAWVAWRPDSWRKKRKINQKL